VPSAVSFVVLGNHAGVASWDHMESPARQPEIALRGLFPKLAEIDLPKAEANLDEYLALALRIWIRLQADPEALATFEVLTGTQSHPTIESKRSNPKPPPTT